MRTRKRTKKELQQQRIEIEGCAGREKDCRAPKRRKILLGWIRDLFSAAKNRKKGISAAKGISEQKLTA